MLSVVTSRAQVDWAAWLVQFSAAADTARISKDTLAREVVSVAWLSRSSAVVSPTSSMEAQEADWLVLLVHSSEAVLPRTADKASMAHLDTRVEA